MDLDLSISPDVFGLRAFDSDKPVSRMLPGSTPCELRLMLPDAKLGIDGFHDVIIENLTASPTWRSSHVSLADIAPAMAEGRAQHLAPSGIGCGATPLRRPEESGQGTSLQSTGFLWRL